MKNEAEALAFILTSYHRKCRASRELAGWSELVRREGVDARRKSDSPTSAATFRKRVATETNQQGSPAPEPSIGFMSKGGKSPACR